MHSALHHDDLSLLLSASLAKSHFTAGSARDEFFDTYLELIYRNQSQPLPGLVLDFMGWLRGDLGSNPERWETREDIHYQEQFVSVLLNSSEFKELKELGSTYKGREFQSFVLLSAQIFFDQIAPSQGPLIPPGFLKEFRKEAQDLQSAADQILDREDLLSFLDPFPWIEGFKKNRPIFSEEDFRELRLVQKIPDESQRKALKLCWKSRTWLEQSLLLKIKKQIRNLPSVDTPDAQLSGTFPMGGIAGISNRGTLSTVLPSELLYSTIKDPVDLFQVKYLENDLLYYLRDQQEIDEYQRKLSIQLSNREIYPDQSAKSHFSIHPFFLFGILSFFVKNLPKFLPTIHFLIDIHLEVPSRREEDYLQILSVLMETSQYLGEVHVRRWNQSADESRQYHSELFLGSTQGREFSMDWNESALVLATPGESWEWEPGAKGLREWVEAGLFLLAGLKQPTQIKS